MEEKKPPPPKQVPKTAPVSSSSNSKVKSQPQAQNKGKGKAQAMATESQRFSSGKCISDGQNNDEISEKGGSQIKISEMISDILEGISSFYIAINDVKSHISDKINQFVTISGQIA
ncbi:hypothetical protein O181_044451 [Austropuccinia psidii MF-1]|uniref:Uncharacterized protein n=1 Tax=Austropuccinia psidii MF-1 TaxID=1389203 RepID=A0A9Q3DIF9_9BASI|nr:hypothetical protein [Austropuccinia psidii MF-1]